MPSTQVENGAVTFLFTDVEGSTRLWESHPESMRVALARHDQLIREAIESEGGKVFKTLGDAFYTVFDSASSALKAALRAQLALHSEPWPPETAIRSRMALHSGVVEHRDRDFFGPAVNRVARLLAAAHGGQTILSAATKSLIGDEVPPDVQLLDLGEHRLKDLEVAEPIYQLTHPALTNAFPALRAQESPILYDNLPQPVTKFVGRERELKQIGELFARTRLLTLTGAGGTGKTRLSLQLGRQLLDASPNGVLFLELAPLSNAELLAPTLATLLGVKEHADDRVVDSIIENLREKRLVLIFDNCEHLIDASAQLATAILRNCSNVKILASSRQALGIMGETTFYVPSLSMPQEDEPVEMVSGYEAVQLFVERAEHVKTGFSITPESAPALATICRRLDGIPLALELAAARMRSLSPQEIVERLDRRFELLTGGSRTALPRQQTLRSLIDWSYDMLEPEERSMLQRLSVFAGGWYLDSLVAMCPEESEWDILDRLTSLCDKSLVVTEEQQGRTRYRLLESIRHYAADRLLEAGDAELWRDRHLNAFHDMGLAAEADLRGPKQLEWLQRLELDHDNLRAAMEWSTGSSDRAELGLRLATAVWRFWYVRGHLHEGRRWLTRLLESASQASDELKAAALNGAGNIDYQLGDYERAENVHREALGIRRKLGDPKGIAASLNNLANLYYEKGDFAGTRAMHEEALAIRRELGDRVGIASSLNNLGNVAFELGEYERSRDLQTQSLEQCRELGHSVGVARSLINLGNVYKELGHFDTSRTLLRESLVIRRELGEKVGIANSLERLAAVASAAGDHLLAAKLWGVEERLRQELTLRRPVNEEKRYEYETSEARAVFPEFEREWNTGRRMSVDEAIVLALGLTE